MKELKYKTSREVIEAYRPNIDKWIEYAFSAGYKAGYDNRREELENLRALCHREAGEHDEEYAEGWGDGTPFYGWCSECKSPHSGRWTHIWQYCPWCGARIDHDAEEPYPTGYKQEDSNGNDG